ncbi:SprB repeat-containing protein, partial [Flavobacterium lipolyticum]
ATVTPTGGTGAYTYSWSPSGGSAATASNLAAGTYTVTINDANLCSITKTVTITEPAAALTATTSQTNVACNAGTTGSATVTVSGGTGAYTYSWAPSGGSAATASNLAAGTYTVTIKDANLCTITKTFTITEPTAITATTSQTNVLCKSNTTGSATVTPTGGTGAYTYSWAPSGGSAATASNLAAGTYTVTIKDANLCTITKTITITEPAAALTATTSQTNVSCNAGTNGSATVTPAGGTGAYTYSWAPSGGSAATASNLAAGTYTVTIKDANLCSITKTFTITEPTILTATTSQMNVGCGGDNTGSATVTVSGGTPGYTYLWSPSGGTAATASNLAAGTYTVTVTDANSCTISKSVTIIDGDSIKPIIDPLPQTSTINCPATPVFATATATDNNGVISSLTYKDVITPGGCAGSYTQTRTWTAVDACGNISLPVSQVIIVQDISAPTWSTAATSLNKTIECSDTAALTAAQALFPTATDACDTDVSNIVKVSGAFVASQGCANAGTYTNTWTVKDDCGNTSSTFTQVITIQDTSKPTWSTQTASLNKTVECSDTAALTAAQALFPTATDACDTNVSNIVKVSGAFVASQGCANAGTYTNTWTVKDDCGNTSATFTQVITIQDTSKPTWSTAAASLNKTVECSDTAALTAAQALFPTATDACDTNVSNIVKVSGAFVASQGCANAGTYTNTWTVKDDCGNTSDTFTQVITIQDTSKPTWSTQTAS